MDALMPAAAMTAEQLRRAVEAQYSSHADDLIAVLRRLTWPGCDVHDLLQEVFVVVLRNARPLVAADSPRAWLYGVAVRVASAARRRQRIRALFRREAAAVTAPRPSVALDPEARATAEVVHRVLAELSAKKREVLVLFELQGLSGPEIAIALGCPLKTVWTRLHHARKDFEEKMVLHG